MKNFWKKSWVRLTLLSVLSSLSAIWMKFTRTTKKQESKMMTEEEIKEYLGSLNSMAFTKSEYDEYKLLMIEEAEEIICHKEKYINFDDLPIMTRISRLNDLIDFFTMEEEKEIVRDLNMVKTAVKLRFYFKEFV